MQRLDRLSPNDRSRSKVFPVVWAGFAQTCEGLTGLLDPQLLTASNLKSIHVMKRVCLLVFWLDNYIFTASDNVSSVHSGNQRCKSRCWVCGRCPLLQEWFCCTLAMIASIFLPKAFYLYTEKVKRSTCCNVPEIDQPIARAWSAGFQGRRPNTWGVVESELGDKVIWKNCHSYSFITNTT